MTIKLTNRFRLFLVFATVLVVLPLLCIFALYMASWITGRAGGPLAMALFIPFTFYYLPVALMFGEPFFLVGIGAGPTGPIGFVTAAFFYLTISYILSFIVAPPGDDVSDVTVKRAGGWVGMISSLSASAYCYYGIRSTLRQKEYFQENYGETPGLVDIQNAALVKWAAATTVFIILAIFFIFLLRKMRRTQ